MDSLTSKLNIQACLLPDRLKLRGEMLGTGPAGCTELHSYLRTGKLETRCSQKSEVTVL